MRQSADLPRSLAPAGGCWFEAPATRRRDPKSGADVGGMWRGDADVGGVCRGGVDGDGMWRGGADGGGMWRGAGGL